MVEIAAARIASEWVAIYTDAAVDTARIVNEQLGTFIDFDRTNQRAIDAMQVNRARLVREFTEAQREATTYAIQQGFQTTVTRTVRDASGTIQVVTAQRAAINPRDMARTFRASVGLTEYQLRIVENYRRALQLGNEMPLQDVLGRALHDHRFDRTLEAVAAGRRNLTAAEIDRMTERYRQRWIAYRAEVIARTEALRSVHQGTEELYRQAVASGTLDPNELLRTWLAGRPPRTRDWHAVMHGQQRPIGVPFTSGIGNALRYPADELAPIEDTANCRCAVTTRFVRALPGGEMGVPAPAAPYVEPVRTRPRARPRTERPVGRNPRR